MLAGGTSYFDSIGSLRQVYYNIVHYIPDRELGRAPHDWPPRLLRNYPPSSCASHCDLCASVVDLSVDSSVADLKRKPNCNIFTS